jgi:phosphoribosyl 1,2-cyclic phosphodiesterase
MIKFASLYSGSSGNCIFVGTDKTRILIDAGLSGVAIISALKSIGEDPANINGILVTHEHSDHIKGVGILSRKFDIPIYANIKTWEQMEPCIGNVKDKNIRIIEKETRKPHLCSLLEYVGESEEVEECTSYKSFEIGDIGIVCWPISHDAKEPVSYALYMDNMKISVATDMGYASDVVRDNLKGSDLLFIESNHDVEKLKKGRYPWSLKKRILSDVGHLSNEACASVVRECVCEGTKQVVLGHLSQENNFPHLAYNASKNMLDDIGCVIGRDMYLSVAKRDEVSDVILL